MLDIVGTQELRSAVASPFFAVESASWLEDCPQVLKCDHLIFDIIYSGSDGVFQFSLKGGIKKLEVFFGFPVLLLIESRRKLRPTVNEGIEWSLEDKALQGSCYTL